MPGSLRGTLAPRIDGRSVRASLRLRRRLVVLMIARLFLFDGGLLGRGTARRFDLLCFYGLALFGAADHANAHSERKQTTNSDALNVQTSRIVTVCNRPMTRSCVAAISALLVPKKSSNCGVEIRLYQLAKL